MATVTCVTPDHDGAACAKTTCTAAVASTVTFTTAQSALDFSKLALVFSNATSAASVITFTIGADFSEVGQGVGTTVTVGTSGSATGIVVLGGTSFESARYQSSSGTFIFTNATSDLSCQAILMP